MLPKETQRFAFSDHPEYFTLMDIRPTATTDKLDAEVTDTEVMALTGHTNIQTTRQFYDRKRVRNATPTE